MGTHVFTWSAPAQEVHVTGTFDNWSKSVELSKENGVFTKQVDLPSASQDIFYKFVVDGKWTTDTTQPTGKDHEGNENNILKKEDIQPLPAGGRAQAGAHPNPNTASAIRSGVGPGATSAALAGAVPLEKDKNSSPSATSDDMPGTFPSETPVKEVPSGAQAASGSSATDFFSAGDIVPDFSTYKSATMPTDPNPSSKENTDPSVSGKAAAVRAGVLGAAGAAGGAAVAGAKQAGDRATEAATGKSQAEDQKVGVNPLPATSGIGNPIHTKPGEKLPPSDKYTTNTTTSNVKLDKESYEKSDAYPTAGSGATGGAATTTMIPESSVPMGQNISDGPADVTAIRSAAGTDTSTAALAGQQPIQPRGVPEVVRDSQQEVHASPEASANPEATAEKSAMEKELKSKVPEENPTSESSTSKSTAAGILGGAGAVAAGGAAAAAGVPSKISSAISDYKNGNSGEKPADAVPEPVKESEKKAGVSPEAAANPEAVKEKSEVERELTSKIPTENSSGQPAPVTSAATTATAPHPQTGAEGGQGKGTAKSAEDGSDDTARKGGILAGVTGAAAAVGGAAYAATQSAKDRITGSTSTPSGKDIPDSGRQSSSSAFANDSVDTKDPHSADPGKTLPMSAAATSTGAKDAIPDVGKASSGSAFASDPTIADEGTAGAIAAATGLGSVGEPTPTPDALKGDPLKAGEGTDQDKTPKKESAAVAGGAAAVGAGSTTAAAPSSSTKDTDLNASKDTPAKSAATAATTSPSTDKKPEEITTARRERQPSRDVSPMTKDVPDSPKVTTGVATSSASPNTAGKSPASPSSPMKSPADADAAKGHKKRKSFFSKLKEKLK